MSVRHDWYQSDTKVVITVLLKNAREKNYNVKISCDEVLMIAGDYQLKLNLFKPINPELSAHKATPSKVEITLAKVTGDRWESLEKKIEDAASLPARKAPDWDRLAKQIASSEAEEVEGNEALQNLFQKIYNDSTEEVRRAMNKSFSESGGTVLSTNWKEVGEKKVDVKPPDGVEFKEWSE